MFILVHHQWNLIFYLNKILIIIIIQIYIHFINDNMQL